jgi:hypothetical protein
MIEGPHYNELSSQLSFFSHDLLHCLFTIQKLSTTDNYTNTNHKKLSTTDNYTNTNHKKLSTTDNFTNTNHKKLSTTDNKEYLNIDYEKFYLKCRSHGVRSFIHRYCSFIMYGLIHEDIFGYDSDEILFIPNFIYFINNLKDLFEYQPSKRIYGEYTYNINNIKDDEIYKSLGIQDVNLSLKYITRAYDFPIILNDEIQNCGNLDINIKAEKYYTKEEYENNITTILEQTYCTFNILTDKFLNDVFI